MGIIGISWFVEKTAETSAVTDSVKLFPNQLRDSNNTAFLKLKICANNSTLTYSITHTSSPPPPMQSCFENDLQHSSNIDKGEEGGKMATLKRWGGEGLRVD